MPDKRLEKGPDGDELTSAPITKPPQPLVIKVLNWLNFSGSSNFFFSDVKKFTCFFYTIL